MATERTRILCVYYNPASTGSRANFTKVQLADLAEKYDITLMIPSDGAFTQTLASCNLRLLEGSLNEKDDCGLTAYLARIMSFTSWLLLQRIKLVVVLDYVYWRPAELVAARFAGVPIISACLFYKSSGELGGAIKYSRRIVVNSRRTQACFLGSRLLKRTRVIHNCIDVEKYAEAPDIRETICPSNTRLIGFVGALRRIKGVEYLIRAMQGIHHQHPNVKLIIVGSEYDTGYESCLREEAVAAGVDVAFLGHRSDIASIMKAIDILVVPSLDEPFGFINIEAGAVGTPVVATKVGGIPEIITDGINGILVPPQDSDAIKNAVNRLLSDDTFRHQLGSAAKRNVHENFSIQLALKAWREVVSECVRR
ncbi:D-inositol 3-phosphate glycosyltransferase [Thiorhodovibrio winogradskyi]|uniref:D-inositol 3-phosphate glycosyltransferase n=1 Tax=Thiorhodovibrio winogradskyi TaxID=77007 RepID=A0ABZ0SAV8_9GAMM|nr:glycosyltransferase family 4 protein [Thiorhodovibrio winogradskyi]